MPTYTANPANLQSLITTAIPGSTILLPPDLPYFGPLVVRPLSGRDRRDIRIMGLGGLATIAIPAGIQRGVTINHGVRGVKIERVQITGENCQTLLSISNDTEAGQATKLSQLPRDITIRSCVILGQGNTIRGVAADGINVLIADTQIRGIHATGSESYAVQTFNTPGQVLIRHCHLEAAGIIVFLGGDDPKIPGLVNAGVTIENCTIVKDILRRGKGDTVKHLIEAKHCRGLVIRGNQMSGVWANEGVGLASAIFLKPSMVTARQTTVDDVLIENNRIKTVANGFRFAVGDAPGGLRNVVVRGNTCTVDRSMLPPVPDASNCHVHFHTAVPDWWIDGLTIEDNLFFGETARDVWIEQEGSAIGPFLRNLQWRRNVMRPGTFPSRPSFNDVSLASEIEL